MQQTPFGPDGFRLTLDLDPPPAFRAELGRRINGFHAETVPFQSSRSPCASTIPTAG